MTTTNRIFDLYSERILKAQFDERELGLHFMYSSIDKHMRGNCVLDTDL